MADDLPGRRHGALPGVHAHQVLHPRVAVHRTAIALMLAGSAPASAWPAADDVEAHVSRATDMECLIARVSDQPAALYLKVRRVHPVEHNERKHESPAPCRNPIPCDRGYDHERT